MNTRLLFVVLPLLAALSSCGKTFSDVAALHQTDFESLKTSLAEAAEAVPENPVNLDLAKPLDPAPKFIKGKLDESNTLISTLEQLKDPNANIPDDKGLDFYLNDVKNLYIWAEQDDKAFDDYEEELQAAFKLRYVVFYQTLEFQTPTMVDAETYDRGGVVMAVYIYDIKEAKIVCAFPIGGQAAEKVSFQYNADSSKMSAGLKHARSTMWEAVRGELFKALEEKTGGSFKQK